MVAKLKTLDDWLSCIDSLSPSKRSRLDQILAGFRPKANEFADDPLGYCREYLGVKLWDKQREIIEKLMTPPYQVLVRAGHNVGKTFVAACLASWFYDSFNPGQTLCTAPTKASVRDILFAELRKLRPNQEGFLPKDTLLQDKPPTSAITHHHHPPPSPTTTHHHCVRGLTTAKSEAFQGRHCERLLLIYDEAVGIEPQLFEKTEPQSRPGRRLQPGMLLALSDVGMKTVSGKR